MKANPGGTLTGDAILGRQAEIDHIWATLEKRSVLLTGERRIGKTCVLRKICEHPIEGWVPILAMIESERHPADCVARIYDEASRLKVRSKKGVWLGRFRSAYEGLAGGKFAGVVLPPIRKHWKHLLAALLQDVTEHTSCRVLVMLDEFPMTVDNILTDHGPSLAMEFLDALRELRQTLGRSDGLRFLLSGSIGLHLIVNHLKAEHGYRGSPTNDMDPQVLSGLSLADTELMCQKYLDEEGIRRVDPESFSQRLHESTDGLPLYIQNVCERFQATGLSSVAFPDVERALRELVDDPSLEGFSHAGERISTHYRRLRVEPQALSILNLLCYEETWIPETGITDHVRSELEVERASEIHATLELLRKDNYLDRDTSSGERRYRFRYRLMREWWRVNKG